MNAEKLSLRSFYSAGFMLFMKGFKYGLEKKGNKRLYHGLLKLGNHIRLEWNLWKERNRHVSNKFGLNLVYNNGGYLAHCHASGDFMLMTRENWMALRGYPEYTPISTHTDSLFSILAYSKLKEKIMWDPVFHQSHERRYGWSDIEKNEKFMKAYQFFEDVANEVKAGNPIGEFLNQGSWGLEEYELDECTF